MVDLVAGSASLSNSGNHASLLELAQNTLDRPLGDADRLGDLAHPNVRIAGNPYQYVPVITQETPGREALFVGCGHN